MGAIFSQLDLTAEQESAIDTIRSQYQPELEAARDTTRTRRESLFDLAHADILDEAAIREQGVQLGMAEAESMILMSRMRQEIHSVLTAEQLAQLEELKEDRGGSGWGRRGPRGPRSGERVEPSEN
jgi:Spy/CpxP family protein refolding chaperone